MSYSYILETSDQVKLKSNSGVIELSAGSHVLANELQLTTKLAVAQGGTGASTNSDARANLGAQAQHAYLDDIAGLAPSSGQIIKYNSGSGHFEAHDESVGTIYSADESTVHLSVGNQFSIPNGGVTATQLNSSAIGDGLQGGSGTSVSVDGSVVRTSGDQSISGTKAFNDNLAVAGFYVQQPSGQLGYTKFLQFEAQSTNNTQFSLGSYAIDLDGAMYVEAEVVACSDDLANMASFKLDGMVINNGGTSSSLQLNNSVVYRSDNSIVCVFDVDDGTDTVRIRATGIPANLRWHANFKVIVCHKYV